MTSTDIVKAQQPRGGALSLANMTAQEAWRFSEALAGAALLPGEYRGNPGSVLWALEYGRALGLDVVTTITTIHVIKGKPTQSADLMLSRAREAGHRVRIKSDRNRCVVSIIRHDDPDDENIIEWTLEDAETAQLLPGKPDSNWRKYPRAMLRARAIAECVRAACPEVLHGAIYTAEELGARVDDAGLPVEAEVQQLHRVQPGESDQWASPPPSQPGTVVVDPEVFVPHPEGQAFAEQAQAAKDKAGIKNLWSLALNVINSGVRAPDTKEPDVLGTYLTRLAATLPDVAPVAESTDEVVDGEVVTTPEDDYANAVAELRDAAEAARLDTDTFEVDAAQALGTALADASTDAIRALAAQLRATAA